MAMRIGGKLLMSLIDFAWLALVLPIVLPHRDVLIRFEDLAPPVRINEQWLHDALVSNSTLISNYVEPLLVKASVSTLWDTPFSGWLPFRVL
ncbi:hypothetical protein L1987_11496 [Smallanthus sonchifolius]|uniref:Uncharacterized protein n=1 Tax=Smallanthus sonchifolius TaxID=185202 RepID=A0ACB9JC00_9ASTR|nr:hypothetical protein L1987_11496 [Smallanthus sonchifolius]